MLFIKDKQQRNVAKLCLLSENQVDKIEKIKYNAVIPFYQLMTFETTPAPTVLPPSLRANLCPVNQKSNHINAMSYTLLEYVDNELTCYSIHLLTITM